MKTATRPARGPWGDSARAGVHAAWLALLQSLPVPWLCLLLAAAWLQSLPIVRCLKPAWHSEDGLTSYTVDRSNDRLTLKCEQPDVGYSCDEMRPEPGRTAAAMARLSVYGCTLREALACVPGAGTATVLELEHTRGLAAESLRGLTAVETLQIVTDKNLTSMPYAALAQLPRLTSLTVTHGALELLAPGGDGAGAGGALPLRVLEVSDCPLRALPAAALARVPALTALSLWDDGIEAVHEDALRNATMLQTLNLNNNALQALPPRLFAGCAALAELYLGDNRLRSLGAAAVSGALSLKVLDLSGNRLEVLPLRELGQHRSLRRLDVSRNSLHAVVGVDSGSLTRLTLTELDLSHNLLTALDHSSLEGLLELEHLDLSHNRLTELDADTLFPLRNHLTNLKLSHNALRLQCPAGLSPLRELTALRRVLLDHNGAGVAAVCVDWLALAHLTHFDLSYNNIGDLTTGDLAWTSSATVDLSNNNITHIQPPAQNNSRSNFILKGNPFACDCEIYSFLQAGRGDARLQDYGDLTCASPPALAGTTLAAARRLPCAACAARCACATDVVTGVYELRCPAPPARGDFPTTHDHLPIRLTLTNETSYVLNLPSTVKYLDLRNLSLTRAPRIDASCVEVDLRDNLLTVVPRNLLGADRKLSLAGNPFRCPCGEVTPEGLRGHEEHVLDFARVACADDHGCAVPDRLVLVASLMACALVLGVGAFFWSKRSVRARARRAILGRRGAETVYDVFLSFADEDAGWVWATTAVALEHEGLRVCVPPRDWPPGGLVEELGARSIREARRTVAVLSPEAARCGWRRRELDEALRLRRAVVLLRDDLAFPGPAPPVPTPQRGLRAVVLASDPKMLNKLRQAICR